MSTINMLTNRHEATL